ncbi:response regulator [Pararobbsia alpina]|uniref:response regulator n=1 Tax=Pararobbsia alpina TaxID=621374 RepID=UPI0039A6B282
MNVLVVDDYEDTAQVFAQLAEALGHQACVAITADAALRIASTTPPDLIFLDISLGLQDGIEVGRRIRADPGAQDCKIVAMSGYADVMSRCEPALFDGFLLKPVRISQLERWLLPLR